MLHCFYHCKGKKNTKNKNNPDDQEQVKLVMIETENYNCQISLYKQILLIYKDILKETNMDKIIKYLKIENNILNTTFDSINSKININQVKVFIITIR